LIVGLTATALLLAAAPPPAAAQPLADPIAAAARSVQAAPATPPAWLGQVGPTRGQNCTGGTVTLEPDGTPAGWQAAVVKAGKNAKICLRVGRYDGFSVTPLEGQQFIGTVEPLPNGHTGKTYLDGSVQLPASAFEREGDDWYYEGLEQLTYTNYNLKCVATRPECNRPDDLYIDGRLQTRVADRAGVQQGSYQFAYTSGNKRLWLGSDPSKTRDIRILRTPAAFSGSAANVHIANLVVERYASPGHEYAINATMKGANWTVHHVEARFNHGGGIGMRGGWAYRNYVRHNGHQGLSGTTGTPLIEYNNIEGNNTAGYSVDKGAAEGGAGKFSLTRPALVGNETVPPRYRKNWVHGNYGQGAWFDVNNHDVQIEDNLVEDNEGVGIMYEISRKGTIRNNIVRGNGTGAAVLGKEGGKEYAYSAGILVSSSEDVTVENNTVTVPPLFTLGVSVARVPKKDKPDEDTWAVKETTHGIILLQGKRNEKPAGCPLTEEDQKKDPTYKPTWGCDLRRVKVTNNVVRYLGVQPNLQDVLPEDVRTKNYDGDGKGKTGSGLLANNEQGLHENNSFSGNTYQMSDCSQIRWYWVVVTKNDAGELVGKSDSGDLVKAKKAKIEENSTCKPL
jgi:parallel beta-helix repeat protein